MARVRFSIDPSKSDEEIADAIMEMAVEHFELPEEDGEESGAGGVAIGRGGQDDHR